MMARGGGYSGGVAGDGSVAAASCVLKSANGVLYKPGNVNPAQTMSAAQQVGQPRVAMSDTLGVQLSRGCDAPDTSRC